MIALVPLLFASDALFTEVGETALPGAVTTCGSLEKDFILEVNGGGVLLEDFDRDGNMDLVVVDGSTLARAKAGEPSLPAHLFLGDGKGGFAAAGDAWNLAGGRWGMGGAVGDVNGDGWPDIFVTHWGGDRLYLNEAGEGFRDATLGSGLEGDRWGTSAAFLDADGDGALDLYVVNYLAFDPETVPARGSGCTWKGHEVMCGPEGLVPVHDQFYRGKGDGTFVEESLARGLKPERAGFGLGVVTLDYDGDGDTDLYVSNDSTPNFLWENQGDGTFVDVGFRRGASHDANGKEQAGMGIACGDLDGDGRPDLFVTNFSGENNALYRSTGSGGFRERSARAGLGGPSIARLGWGTGMADFDLDGALDLFVMNGHVYPQADKAGTDTSYAQLDQFFRGDREGRFAEELLSDAPATTSRAAATADLDNDGDLDIVALSVEGPVRVLLNGAEHGPDRHWLRVRLVGRGGNTAGLGARVTARWKDGSRSVDVRTAGGFQASLPAEAHFGFGALAELEALEVRWPSGVVQRVEAPALDRVLVVEEEAR
ncbi:MAG: CRTAC1 family protein [Planctomycetes bacterium]|nr:CRTAC1 family protein [Planctomycetota bacterium]MCB9904701.1 CRTAC1 family protein [Planctomycetota bacterium]